MNQNSVAEEALYGTLPSASVSPGVLADWGSFNGFVGHGNC